MSDREKVIKELTELHDKAYENWVHSQYNPFLIEVGKVCEDAIAMLKEQEDRHRLEVHNIGNVDIPEGVSEEHFHLVMNNVVEALQHTDKGESYPYEDTGR